MLKEIILTSIKIIIALPGAIGALAGLRKIAQESEFDKSHPESFQKLSTLINDLLYILLEYWIPYILVSIIAGTIWALLVVEPKAKALSDFRQQRQKRLGE